MKLLFWNVQRLGAATSDERKKTLDYISTRRVSGVDYHLYCELMPGADEPDAQQLIYGRNSPHQLCYGCTTADGTTHHLQKITPITTDAYKAAAFKGGNDFTKLATRAVGYLGVLGNVNVYVIHAPASNNALKVMSFLACYLDEHYDRSPNPPEPWLVVGDFNVPPNELSESHVAIEMADYIRAPTEPTHIGRNRDVILDYAISNFHASVYRLRCSPRTMGSDHYPIVVEW